MKKTWSAIVGFAVALVPAFITYNHKWSCLATVLAFGTSWIAASISTWYVLFLREHRPRYDPGAFWLTH